MHPECADGFPSGGCDTANHSRKGRPLRSARADRVGRFTLRNPATRVEILPRSMRALHRAADSSRGRACARSRPQRRLRSTTASGRAGPQSAPSPWSRRRMEQRATLLRRRDRGDDHPTRPNRRWGIAGDRGVGHFQAADCSCRWDDDGRAHRPISLLCCSSDRGQVCRPAGMASLPQNAWPPIDPAR